MAYLGKTKEKTMYYGAPPEIIQRARELRKNMTPAEKLLWEKLRKKQLKNTRFYRQQPIDIFIADFYCHKYKLVIELDGGIHKDPEVVDYDKNRTAHFERFGITVIRFNNEEIFNDIENVLNKILKFM